MKPYLHGPTDYAKNAQTAILCRGPGPTRKNKDVYQYSGGGRRTDVPLCQSKTELQFALWKNVKCTIRNGMCWR